MSIAYQGGIIKSYVWHGDRCFYVSTIERNSSAMDGPVRYNETIVWDYDWMEAERGAQRWQGEDVCGSIRTHMRMCELLYETGKAEAEEAHNSLTP